MEHKAARRYLRQVKRALPWGGVGAELTQKAHAMVAGYIQENPTAQSGDLSAAFGPARDFAQNMLATIDPQTVDRAQRRQRWLCRGGVAALALALVAVAAVCFVRWRKLQAILPDDGNFAIIGPVEYITDEDAEKIFNDPNATVSESHEAYIEDKNIIQERN